MQKKPGIRGAAEAGVLNGVGETHPTCGSFKKVPHRLERCRLKVFAGAKIVRHLRKYLDLFVCQSCWQRPYFENRTLRPLRPIAGFLPGKITMSPSSRR